jgi:hypothetical protein
VSEIPIEFVLFALTLAGVAFFHRQTMKVALTGLAVISVYKIGCTGFKSGPGIAGFVDPLAHHWMILMNLFCLLSAFALLARHFEKSRVPLALPKFLPHDWKGGFILLAMIWVLSSFLDNIAAALVGGAMAHQLFRAKVHIGYLAAIVAASNAGGAWSVVGDTTTTMMWISGVSPLAVFEAIIASSVALLFFGICAAKQQHKYSPMLQQTHEPIPIDWARIGIVALMLVAAIVTNVTVNVFPPSYSDYFPFIGVAVCLVLLLSVAVRRPDWEVLGEVFKGSVFLLALVLCASMMPVEKLPRPSWVTALQLGFLSAVFDNIPLTALALKQAVTIGDLSLISWLRWLDDMVRFLRGSRPVQSFSRSEVSDEMASSRAAHCFCICHRFLCDALVLELAPRRTTRHRKSEGGAYYDTDDPQPLINSAFTGLEPC